MQKIFSLRLLENPNLLAWVYPNYLPVPQEKIIEVYNELLVRDEPRIFYLTENVIKAVGNVLWKPDPDDPDGANWDPPFDEEEARVVDSPFANVMIEAATPILQLTSDCPLLESERPPEDENVDWNWKKGSIDQNVFTMAFKEITPGNYKSFAIVGGELGDPNDRKVFEKYRYNTSPFVGDRFMVVMLLHENGPFIDPDNKYDHTALAENCLFHAKSLFHEMKSKYAVGEEKVRERIRVGTGKDRELKKVKNIIHVALKKERNDFEARTGITVNWTHRWEVMGHWRKVDTIGKDRNGVYGIQGYTWVKAHTKGPESKELVKKIRIVKAGIENLPSQGLSPSNEASL